MGIFCSFFLLQSRTLRFSLYFLYFMLHAIVSSSLCKYLLFIACCCWILLSASASGSPGLCGKFISWSWCKGRLPELHKIMLLYRSHMLPNTWGTIPPVQSETPRYINTPLRLSRQLGSAHPQCLPSTGFKRRRHWRDIDDAWGYCYSFDKLGRRASQLKHVASLIHRRLSAVPAGASEPEVSCCADVSFRFAVQFIAGLLRLPPHPRMGVLWGRRRSIIAVLLYAGAFNNVHSLTQWVSRSTKITTPIKFGNLNPSAGLHIDEIPLVDCQIPLILRW